MLQLIFWSLMFIVCMCVLISATCWWWRQNKYQDAMRAYYRQCHTYQFYRFIVFGDDTAVLKVLWNNVDIDRMIHSGWNPFILPPSFRTFVLNKEFYDEVMQMSRTEMLCEMYATNPEMCEKFKQYIGEL